MQEKTHLGDCGGSGILRSSPFLPFLSDIRLQHPGAVQPVRRRCISVKGKKENSVPFSFCSGAPGDGEKRNVIPEDLHREQEQNI